MPTANAPKNISIRLKKTDGEEFQLLLPTGQSLMMGLRDARQLLGVCGGNAACGTCRLTVDSAWIHRLPPMLRVEKRLISALVDENSTDRLACQIKLESWMEGLAVQLPENAMPDQSPAFLTTERK